MAVYNFKKETKVYVVRNGSRYTLDIYPDLSFSQTFNETSVPVKTLHSQYDMFENAVISKANPANFNFTVPVLYQNDLNILFELLLDYDRTSSEATLKTADLYFETNSEVYKLEKAVMESGIFQIQNSATFTVTLSGTGRWLSKHTGAIPGTVVARTGRSFTRVTAMTVSVAGVVQPSITSVTMEVRNNVTWFDFTTLQNSQNVSSASSAIMRPEAFVVGSRSLSGTVQQYITDETRGTVQSFSTSVPILVQLQERGKSPFMTFAIPQAVYTNRLEVQDLYIQSYDFRMTSNPSSLANIVIKS